MDTLNTASGHLARIAHLEDSAIDLLDGALALARWSDPSLEIEPYRRHAKALIQDAHMFIGDTPISIDSGADAARQILARRYGYGTIRDPHAQADTANISRVIDRRTGSAAALCLLYAHVLDGLGLKTSILDFSARPLIRIENAHGTRQIIDPLNDGRTLDARALRHAHQTSTDAAQTLDPFRLDVLTKRSLLVRLQDQIKSHFLRKGMLEAALLALEATLLIAPDDARLWREAGSLHLRFDHVTEAISALEHLLRLPGADAQRYTTSQILQSLYAQKGMSRP